MNATPNVELSGVPETMLWTLHDRASEARRPNGILKDPDAVRICDALSIDLEKRFGPATGMIARRAQIFDAKIRAWMHAHPHGTVVELACGLETQFLRCDNGSVTWLCVDLPESIEVRERFLPPSVRNPSLRISALDNAWMHAVDKSRPVLISIQGLLMYFSPRDVQRLLVDIATSFPGAELIFDVVPRWLSLLTQQGLQLSAGYRPPPMPCGINRSEIAQQLHAWLAGLQHLSTTPYRAPRGATGLLMLLGSVTPQIRTRIPCVVALTLPSKS